MTSRRSIAMTWARAHRVGPRQILILITAWVAAAALTHVGLPPLQPGPLMPQVNLQLAGVAAVAVVAGIASLALHDDFSWLSRTSARPVRPIRVAWIVTVWAVYLGGAVLVSPLLPRGLPVLSAFLAASAIYFAVAALTAVIIGPIGGLLAPLLVMVVLTGRIVPWEYNIVFNADLTAYRLALAGLGVLFSCIAYVLRARHRAMAPTVL